MAKKNFRVAVCYEEGFVMEVEAENSKQAKKIAYKMVDYWGTGVTNKCVHRDFWVDTVEEIVNA